ncbi:RsfA family transcriptional regulator [Evansella clarkii]|uniref:RsfA family transcriptional regulator n=1 Tax=Evansella clarkii TaxID=79879 RepID=UPI000B44EA81|nr:RsfA family transcriptional regulator [Evansella clarkii]
MVRQDAWNQDEDLLLAEVVLRHIREGSTQLSAFEEVGDRLSRTPAACGFRWNSTIRKKYESAIQLAKKQRKQVKKNGLAEKVNILKTEHVQNGEAEGEEKSLVQLLDEVIQMLSERREKIRSLYDGSNVGAGKSIQKIKEENEKLQTELARLKQEHEIVKNDYQLMINVVERAAKRTHAQVSAK